MPPYRWSIPLLLAGIAVGSIRRCIDPCLMSGKPFPINMNLTHVMDLMNRATLDIDLRCAAQGKAITTMVPMIAEHGFHRTEALVIDGLASENPQ